MYTDKDAMMLLEKLKRLIQELSNDEPFLLFRALKDYRYNRDNLHDSFKDHCIKNNLVQFKEIDTITTNNFDSLCIIYKRLITISLPTNFDSRDKYKPKLLFLAVAK
jgi:hypothetical protein